MIAEYEQIDLIKELCADLRIKEDESFAVAGALLYPIASRSARLDALTAIKSELEKTLRKEVIVTADLDIYCRLAGDATVEELATELKRRKSFV